MIAYEAHSIDCLLDIARHGHPGDLVTKMTIRIFFAVSPVASYIAAAACKSVSPNPLLCRDNVLSVSFPSTPTTRTSSQ